MPDTIMDRLRRIGASVLDKLFVPVGVVDDTPPTLADGDTPPMRVHKTNYGIYVHVANASGGEPGTPTIVQGSDGMAAERLATYDAQTDGTQKTQITDGTNDVAVMNSDPTNEHGLVTRNIPSGTQDVAVASLPLPADAATQTTLEAVLALLAPAATAAVPQTPKTVPTITAEAIVGSSTPATRFVRVTSDFANTKTVYVGDSTVTAANGQPLGPGDVYTADVDNAALLFGISADASQVLRIEVL
jgi:hypothetical protein